MKVKQNSAVISLDEYNRLKQIENDMLKNNELISVTLDYSDYSYDEIRFFTKEKAIIKLEQQLKKTENYTNKERKDLLLNISELEKKLEEKSFNNLIKFSFLVAFLILILVIIVTPH